MKKVLLTAMTLVGIATSSAFGMYGSDSSWMDFLVHGNQFRARMNQLGVTIGNGTIKGTVGFKSENAGMGNIFRTDQVKDENGKIKNVYDFMPTVSAGIGYTSSMISVGLGYSYTYKHTTLQHDNKGLSVHTPVLALNAMNDSFRLVVPVSIASKNYEKKTGGSTDKTEYLGVSTDIQMRYYTGIDAFSLIRLYVKYGQNAKTETKTPTGGTAEKTETAASSLGFDLRLFFAKTTVGNVILEPFMKVTFDTALNAKGKALMKTFDDEKERWVELDHYSLASIKAGSALGYREATAGEEVYESNPYVLQVLPSLGLSASSDVVSLYLEPALGYRARFNGKKGAEVEHALRWNAYGELYVTPVKDLEWYVEAEIGNGLEYGDAYVGNTKGIVFATGTGITWYLPSFGADAQ